MENISLTLSYKDELKHQIVDILNRLNVDRKLDIDNDCQNMYITLYNQDINMVEEMIDTVPIKTANGEIQFKYIIQMKNQNGRNYRVHINKKGHKIITTNATKNIYI